MLKIILFDLDGTLYKSAEVYQKFAEAAYHTYARVKNTTIEKAKELLEAKRNEMKKERGYAVPYTLALQAFDIPIERWHEENIKFFDAGTYLSEDKKLQNVLKRLKNRYKLGVLTNNNKIQTERILSGLGIEKYFDFVFTYESFKLIKPNSEIFEKIMKKMGVKPDECLMVGDRYDVDLVPAEEIGMEIFEVKGPEDIERLK